MAALLIACALAFVLGFAAHRASVCTVRAIAEVVGARTAYMLASIGKSAVWVIAITLPFFWLMSMTAMELGGWSLTSFALLGGFLFGVGAGVNGACAFSTMARFVDGEGGMAITVLGFALGVLGFVALVDLHWLARPEPAPNLIGLVSGWAWLIEALIVLWALYEIARLWRARPRGASLAELVFAPQYRLSTAALLIGMAGSVIFLLVGSPGYTTTLLDAVEGYLGMQVVPSIARWSLLFALFAGMATSTLQRKSFRLDWRPQSAWLRHMIGGTLMGFGTALVPGGNDALVLYGIPSLSRHALPAFFAMAIGIAVGLWVMRRIFGIEMRVACRNDRYVADLR
jgi:uncharacterized protein